MFKLLLGLIFSFPLYQSPLGNIGLLITLVLSLCLYIFQLNDVRFRKIDAFLVLVAVYEIVLYLAYFESSYYLHLLRSLFYLFLVHIFLNIRPRYLQFSVNIYLTSILIISSLTIIATMLNWLGFDMLPFAKIARYSEYISLADHPKIGGILDKDMVTRLTWGNPTDFAIMLFGALVLVLETSMVDNKFRRNVYFILVPALALSLSRTFILAGLLYLFFGGSSITRKHIYTFVKRYLAFPTVVVMGIFVVASYGELFRIDNIINFEAGVRFRMHQMFFESINNYLYFGAGNFYFSELLFDEFGYKTTAESLYLTLGTNYGVVTSGILILFLVWRLFSSKAISSILILLLLAIGIVIPLSSYIFFYIFIGTIFSIKAYEKNKNGTLHG